MRISPTIEYRGESKTLVEWSKDLGIKQTTLGHRYRLGKRGDDLFLTHKPKSLLIKYHGSTKTFAEWCRHFGVDQRRAHERYLRGKDLDLVFSKDPLQRSNKTLDGFTYKGVTKPLFQWCKEFKISYPAVIYRIENKWSENRIFEPPTRSRPSIIIEYLGDRKSLAEWCKQLGVGYGAALTKFNAGLPLDLVFKKLPTKRLEEISLENHWFTKLERIKKQQEVEKEIFQVVLGKMRRNRYLQFRKYLREAEAEAIMRVSA